MKTREEIEAMSDEERRIKTAELCGWRRIYNSINYGLGVNGFPAAYQGDLNSVEAREIVPDYLNSLDAMHEAERIMKDAQAYEYREALRSIAVLYHFNDGMCGCSGLEFFSSAHQRNCAFLMVML